MIKRTYTVSIVPQTKTSYSDNKVFWESGDVIKYYSCDEDTPKTFIVQTKGEKTDIKATVGENDKYFIAYYGNGECQSNLSSGFVISDAVGVEQNGSFANAHISSVKTSDITNNELSFTNITSLVKFSLDRNDVERMTFTSNDGTKICGDIKVIFDENDTPTATFVEETSGSNISVNTCSGSGPFYFSTLPVIIEKGFTCAFYDKSGNKLGVIKTEKEFVIKRNEIINLGTLDTRILPEAEDISKAERANCYLVSEIRDYMFNAQYRGNSTDPVGEVCKAKVLWETNNTNHSPGSGGVIKDVEYTNGYIRFTPVADGNASIAALDNENNILWSWHIWVCLGYDAYSAGQEYVYKTNAGTSNEQTVVIGRFMDRNLGALSNAPGDAKVYGLMYEWGRKDPFLGYNTTGTVVWLNEQSSEITGTLEYATAHPTSFLYGTAATDRDWLVEHNNELWNSEKTEYDPCPPGWRVPDDNVWALGFGLEGASFGVYDKVKNGMQFGGILGPDASIWYPVAGYRDPGQRGIQQNFGRYGYWWSCNSKNEIESNVFKIYSTNEFTPKSSSRRSYGFSVRCVSTYVPPVPEPILVERVEVSPTSLTLKRYHSRKLECKVYPENADHKTVTWKSDNPKIAEVSQDGNITACFEGTCIITATSEDGPSASCIITVESAENVDLSVNGTANCYLVSTPGTYKFKANVKGNSNEPINNGVKAKLLWESFGNNIIPYVETILFNVDYAEGYISFEVPTVMRDGNAVIALVDDNEKILWSWHIWAFKGYDIEKSSQTYYNNAVMMRCNLGAVSEEKGNIQNLGLLYQWGRKDPFLASDAVTSHTRAASTLAWPAPASSGTIEYSIEHPTTFMLGDSSKQDWTEDDNTRWGAEKTKYDPCPVGWRVPNGGASGVWSIRNKYYPELAISDKGLWQGSTYGCDFGGVFGDNSIWYPASEYLSYKDGSIYGESMYGMYWSATVNNVSEKAYDLYFNMDNILLSNTYFKATGMAVRCMKENTFTGVPLTRISICCVGSNYLAHNGDSVVLEAILTPANATYKYVVWENYNPELVSMDVDVEGNKVTITRVCDEDNDNIATIMLMSPDGDKYCQYNIYCRSEDR